MFLECWNFLVAHIFIPIGNGAAALLQNGYKDIFHGA